MLTHDSKNVLIADDSIFFRTQLSDIITEAGHKVSCVKNGLKLIEVIKAGQCSIDLLILDLQMPKMDGFSALKWLKENGYAGKFPVLVSTGAYEAGTIVNDLRELGASGFMSKASTPEQILFRVNNLLFPTK